MGIESLLIDERDIPKMRYQERQLAAKKAQALREHEVRRFRLSSGNIIDVLGNGEFTRIWLGKDDNSVAFGTLNQEEFRRVTALYSEAMGKVI